MSEIPEDVKIRIINTIWQVLINNNNIAPDRFQQLQILITFSIYTNSMEKAAWITDNYNSEERINALNTILSPWCMYILQLIGIERPSSPDTITSIENVDIIP